MSNLTVVAVLFLCSMVAAYILFKILDSSAKIEKKEYKVGGAAAGFLVIYAALYGSFAHLEEGALSTCQAQAATCAEQETTCRQRVSADEKDLNIQGVVTPPLKNATISLSVESTNLDDSGRFLLKGRGVDPKKDSLVLYVITEKTRDYYQIFSGDDVSNIKFSVPGN